ncbi:MAG TPA: PLP-dependent aminotransferase family protein [Chitinophagaceae bacterium]|nr:PLP-dependent aminotransferase family protein [Chitinophagaceae bacterium]
MSAIVYMKELSVESGMTVPDAGLERDFLYVQLCERIKGMIRNFTLKPGDKLPSIRSISKEQGISITTAYKAYSELEVMGLIEARTKSGYYVKPNPRQLYRAAKEFNELTDMGAISADEMPTEVYKNLAEESLIQLSLSAPAVSLLPKAKLNKTMAEMIRKSSDGGIGYESIQGNDLLRKEIARHSFNWGGNLNADDIVTTQGCIEALTFCLMAVTSPGDAVAIETPGFFRIVNVLKSLGLKAVKIPTNAETGPDLNYLKTVLPGIKACLFTPSFNNPMGSCMPDTLKKELVEMLANHDIPLIEDDVFGECYFGDSRPKTCKSYDKKGLVLLCSSVSKTLAPGYRVGWCIPGKFIKKVIQVKITHSLASPGPTHATVGLFFKTGRLDLHLRKLRRSLSLQCVQYTQAITKYFPKDTQISSPTGGCFLWIRLNEGVDSNELFQKAMEDKICIAPGNMLAADTCFVNYIRLGIGDPFTRTIEESLETLARLIKEMIVGKK